MWWFFGGAAGRSAGGVAGRGSPSTLEITGRVWHEHPSAPGPPQVRPVPSRPPGGRPGPASARSAPGATPSLAPMRPEPTNDDGPAAEGTVLDLDPALAGP